jgi:hypothetical protein
MYLPFRRRHLIAPSPVALVESRDGKMQPNIPGLVLV